MSRSTWRSRTAVVIGGAAVIGAAASAGLGAGQAPVPQPAAGDSGATFNDSHFHLTNYVQEGIGARDFLRIMGTRVGRSTLFGIPLQQQWSYGNSGDFAPTYYLHTDAPLYYYSFTDAAIAVAYSRLTKDEQARFDPMITGFNPADMYAADHIRRVLQTFPGVFTGIGEFSIHKEFVSAKIAGETASLTNPALDRVLEFAAASGLVVILHNDIDMPFGKVDAEPVYLAQTKALLRRHPKASIIWAHTGLGRIVRPVQVSADAAERHPTHLDILEAMLTDAVARPRELRHLVGRGREVRGVVAAGQRPRGGDPQPASGPLPVRHRHRGPGRARAVLRGVRPVGAGLEAAERRCQPESAPRQLRADLRRGAPSRTRLGGSQCKRRSVMRHSDRFEPPFKGATS